MLIVINFRSLDIIQYPNKVYYQIIWELFNYCSVNPFQSFYSLFEVWMKVELNFKFFEKFQIK